MRLIKNEKKITFKDIYAFFIHLVIIKSCLRKFSEKNFSINNKAEVRRSLNLSGSSAKAFTKLANGPAFFSKFQHMRWAHSWRKHSVSTKFNMIKVIF